VIAADITNLLCIGEKEVFVLDPCFEKFTVRWRRAAHSGSAAAQRWND
jgi:hypothetical protein